MPFFRMTSCCLAMRSCGTWTPTTDPDEAPSTPAPFDRSAKIEWSPVWSLRDERFKYLPTSLLYFFYRGPGQINADSNGCAAGNTLEEAIVQGFLELVERDAYAIWWYNRLQRRKWTSASSTIPTSAICKPSLPKPDAGFGCSTSPAISGFRALWRYCTGCTIRRKISSSDPARTLILESPCCARLTELNQFLSIGLMGGGTGEKSSLDGSTPLRLRDHPFLTPSDNPAIQPAWLEVRPSRHARAGDRLRASRQARGPRLPRSRSDAPRHRCPGRQSDRSGNAAFLSPLRAWPALRCSGKARIARPAAVWKTSSIQFTPIPEGYLGLRAPEIKRGRRAAPPTVSARLSGHVTLEAHANGQIVACFDGYSVDLGTFSAAPRIARRTCALVCHSPRLRPADGTSTRRLTYWCGDWPGTVYWSTASRVHETMTTRSSSNRRLPIIGRECRSSAMPTFSSCHGSRTCDGAATRWCWNCRAPERCSKFAIRRSRRPSPHCLHRNKSNGSVGRTVFRGSSFSPCWWIAKSFSRSTPLRQWPPTGRG